MFWRRSCVWLFRVAHCAWPASFWTRFNAIFGHIARMLSTVPVHRALCCQVDLSLGRLLDRSLKRRPGHPLRCCVDQICDDSQYPHRPPCGEILSGAVIEEWHNGPWRLCADDDVDNSVVILISAGRFGRRQRRFDLPEFRLDSVHCCYISRSFIN